MQDADARSTAKRGLLKYAGHSFSATKMDSESVDVGGVTMDSETQTGGPCLRRSRSFPDVGETNEDGRKIKIGVCAMDKKARSNPMTEVIKRLVRNGEFEVNIFGDETILEQTVEDWPDCDCLLSWHSDGFPSAKALKYVEHRKPFLINDLSKQHILLDRRKVYAVLEKSNIPVPNHFVVSRDGLKDGEDPEGLIEEEEYVEYNGKRIYKPFVEKPASGEDHNIYIYYPQPMGGGVKRLFRKIDNKSADYDPHHPGTIRRNGSFIYEEFVATGGTDVKVYTVGPRYAHAEARKSPVVDGKVNRTKEGKEVRFPVLLNPEEKEIARMVTFAFGQKVCGFDLLRSDKGSFVCDVNGWSFVKSSYKYYDDAAGILRTLILASLAPERLAMAPRPTVAPYLHKVDNKLHMRDSVSFDDLSPLENGREKEENPHWEELRCVLVVIRHGDRTPKQKMKLKVTQAPFLELFEKHKDAKGKQAKLKSPAQLQELLDVTREMLKVASDSETVEKCTENEDNPPSDTTDSQEMGEIREKLRMVVSVLEAGGHFSGINRKVQLKPTRWSTPVEGGGAESRKVEEVLLILKHGGVLTHAGRQQAEELGSHFRTVMYPSAGGRTAGGGLLRLHSTYRHDLKIYSSDEGRVQTSAAAFAKGLLDLEGTSLTPILVSLVKKDTPMLDAFDKGASDDIQRAKMVLYEQMTWDKDREVAAFTPPPGSTPNFSPPVSPMPTIGKECQESVSPEKGSTSSALGSDALLVSNGEGSDPLDPTLISSSIDLAETGSTESERMAALHNHCITSMPENPLALLNELFQLLDVLVQQLRAKCMEEGKFDRTSKPYSSLSQLPDEWEREENKPCSGEKLLLMYDRWRKLHRSFFNQRRGTFDISKIPDIYDSAKYDAIHNSELNLELEELYSVARVLANVVIPNEYGINPENKLRIGSRICSQLLGKLLADLENTKRESKITAKLYYREELGREIIPYGPFDNEFGYYGWEDESYAPNIGSRGVATEINSEGDTDGGEDDDREPETLHRLCPSYALDINSPLRHVRTRIYFTSESHIHALVNILRYCHLGADNPREPLVCKEGGALLEMTPELDYLTHIVFRMFENTQVPFDDPNRFRVEILFSPGAAYNPFEVSPRQNDHVMPTTSRTVMHRGNGVSLDRLEELVTKFSQPRKLSQPYSWLMGTKSAGSLAVSPGKDA